MPIKRALKYNYRLSAVQLKQCFYVKDFFKLAIWRSAAVPLISHDQFSVNQVSVQFKSISRAQSGFLIEGDVFLFCYVFQE